MENKENAPEAVKLVLDTDTADVSGVDAETVKLFVPTDFPGIAKETLDFLNKVGLHYASKHEGFSASFVMPDGRELDVSCEVFIRADDSVWAHFNEDDDQHVWLGSVAEFAERVRQAQAEAKPSSTPKMGA